MKDKPRHAEDAMEKRHKGFQLGTDPMHMTPFERELVQKDKYDRQMAKDTYVRGIQGVDGGTCEYSHT